MMHREASANLLFAKSIQWRSVGSTLLVFAGFIAISEFSAAAKPLHTMLSALVILLTCGVIFILILYQFWQFNEVNRIREIDRHFSSLYMKINTLKSGREANTHRYTILFLMSAIIVLGGIVTGVALQQIVSLKAL